MARVPSTVVPPADAALLDELEATLREERRRGPTDLLALLAILLTGSAVAMVALGLLAGDGPWRDLLLNLTGEALGAALTVVVIGGVWARLQTDSVGALADLERRVERHRSEPLTDEERVAFQTLIDIHRRTRGSGPVVRLGKAVAFTLQHRRRLGVIEDLLRDPRTADR
jgi:hypothetical protein